MAQLLTHLNRFVELIEREWLNGGHQFSWRHHHTTFAPDKEKAPVFLLFLDAVWQVRCEEGVKQGVVWRGEMCDRSQNCVHHSCVTIR